MTAQPRTQTRRRRSATPQELSRMTKMMNQALDTLSHRKPTTGVSLLSRLVEQHYDKIGELRRKGWSWPEIGKELNAHGVPYGHEALRRSVKHYEQVANIRPGVSGWEGRRRRPAARKH